MSLESTASHKKRKSTGGKHHFIHYGRQWIDEEDIEAVVETLRSDWLTTGPKVGEFEKEFARFTGAGEAVAVSSGTAALHSIMHAIGVGPGDEIIVPPITFAATANAVVFQGGKPVFADVDPETLLIDPEEIKSKITPRTTAIVAVDYAGQPCNYDALQAITDRYGITLIADACHALGAQYKGEKVGALADLTAFSFHPVKHITTGEGGMITTDNPILAERMRVFRNHGITTDHRQREEQDSWRYEMVELGYNYRITDFQCALGVNQLNKLPKWLARRQQIAGFYDAAFEAFPYVKPLSVNRDVLHAYHLYVVRIMDTEPSKDRKAVFKRLKEKGIGVNVHYLPVYLHPFYKNRFHTDTGLCPVAEQAYENILSLPMFPRLKSHEQKYIIKTIKDIWS